VPAIDRTSLKALFENGDLPTASNFIDLIDTPLVLSASTGTALHSTACFTASPGLAIAQSGSVITYAYERQNGACAFLLVPVDGIIGNSATISASVASTPGVYRFYLDKKISVATVYFNLITACNAACGGVGIYSNNGASLLVNAAGQSLSPLGVRTVTLSSSVTLDPGYYLYAWISDIAGPDFAGVANSGLQNAITFNAGVAGLGRGGTGTNGSLPTTVGTIASGTLNVPFAKFQG
jgi:hypothetical protein